MSTAQFTCPLIVTIPGQVIASSLWNNEFTNIFTNGNPSGIGAYSDTDPQMQTATDPFPAGTSRPTSLAGELERIRYILNLIIGGTYWYNHPPIDLTTLNTSTPVIPSGTKMPFYQAAAPTGWTAVTVNDKFFRVVSSGTTGGTTGGSGATPGGTLTLAHTHTVASHTHDLANHTHTMGNHTHTSAAHTHSVPHAGWTGASNQPSGSLQISTSLSFAASADQNTGSTTPGSTGGPSTNTSDGPSTNTSGAATPATDSQLSNTGFQYADFIIATKN